MSIHSCSYLSPNLFCKTLVFLVFLLLWHMQHSHVQTWTPIPRESDKKPKLRVIGGVVSIYNHIYIYLSLSLLMIISIWMHTRLPLATLLGIISVSESAPRSEILIGWPGWTFVNRALVGMSPLDRWLGGTSAGCDIAKWTWTNLWMSYGWLIDDVPINHSFIDDNRWLTYL